MPSPRALPEKQNDKLRQQLRKVIDRDFDGVLSRAAEAFKVSHATLSDVLSKKRGVGQKLLAAMADHTGQSLDGLLGRQVEYDPAMHRTGDRVRQHPQWPEASAELRRRHARRGVATDESAMTEIGDMGMSRVRPQLTADYLFRLYEAVLQDREDNSDGQGSLT